MTAGWKTVRGFISSTFRDMHRERNHLVRMVFPELKERCRAIHVQLIDVDLRWGVTEADAEHGKALDTCLDEIDSCRPYFIGILGHRYGFVPEGHHHSITAQEIYHGSIARQRSEAGSGPAQDPRRSARRPARRTGDNVGHLFILRLQNFSFGPYFVTPWQHNPHPSDSLERGRSLLSRALSRIWQHNPHPLDSLKAPLHFGCPLCRVWSEAAASELGAEIPCPHCRGSIKLNPFTINADWHPIAAAWKATADDE